MRQKYTLVKNEKERRLLIREYAELDRGRMSLMCEESYPINEIRPKAAGGKESLARALRTNNMYPPTIYLNQIAAAAITLLDDATRSTLELFFDDAELLMEERQSAGALGNPLENGTA